MFDLYTWPTPNGRKVSILFEELEVKYSAIPINISKGDQFSGKFTTISIDNKIPIIYSDNSSMNVAALRLKGQICENSKMLCYHNVLPELNHNEIVGWENNSIFVFPGSAVANLPIKDVFLFNLSLIHI